MTTGPGKSLRDALGTPGGIAGVAGLALVAGVGVLAFGKLAAFGVLGIIAFLLFVRQPVWGLYLTTLLLLLSGPAAFLGSFGAAMQLTGAKLCGAATLVAWVVNAVARRRPFRAEWKMFVMLAFLLWSPIGVFLSPYFHDQFPEWVRVATLIGFFIMAVNLLETREDVHRFVILLLLCGFVTSLFAIAQYVVPKFQVGGTAGLEEVGAGTAGAFIDVEGVQTEAAVRVSGAAGHSTWLAMTLLMILPLNAYWFATVKGRRGRVFGAIMILTELIALVFTFTRSGFVVGVGLVLALAAKRLVRVNPYRLVAVALLAIVAWFLVPTAYKERVLSFGSYAGSQSTQARLELQSLSWKYVNEHPVFGIGIGGFGMRLLEERRSDMAQMYRWMVDLFGWRPASMGTHNMYLQVASETGVFGLALLLVFFMLCLHDLHRAEKTFESRGDHTSQVLAASLWVSLFSFLICALLLHALQQKIWWMVAASGTVMALLAKQGLNDGSRLPEPDA